ncbi:MAG TPA: hypothetical protein VFU89_03935 [Rhabdochlamydiaceae bacterium]|nr:hypothetical protein [Rhabdochlamydiaceae bacterium]
MATTNALGSPRTPPVQIPSTDNLYFAKINWVFIFSMACIAAGISYCAYNLYQFYQLVTHTGYGLDDPCKLVKCKALLLEAKKAGEKESAILHQCESLLNTIKDSRHSDKKEKLLLQLTQHYAQCNLEMSLLMAKELTTPFFIFKAAQSISKKNPDRTLLLTGLYQRAYYASLKNWGSGAMDQCLKIAQAAHELHDKALPKRIVDQMVAKAHTLESPSEKISAFCKIAECAHKIEDQEVRDSALGEAKKLSQESLNFQDHLCLANAYFSMKKFQEMDAKIDESICLFNQQPISEAILHIHPLATIIHAISKNEQAQSKYKNFSVQDMFTKAIADLPQEEDSIKCIKAYLSIARIYKDKLVDHPITSILDLKHVSEDIQKLPATTNEQLDAKINYLEPLLPHFMQEPKNAKPVMQILEELYDKYPVEVINPWWNKFELGELIVRSYNKMKLSSESETFFNQKYLPFFQNGTAFDRIGNLTSNSSLFNPDQTKTMLQAAEDLLSQCSGTEYQLALRQIADAYLTINSQKSLSLFASYETSLAKTHLIICGLLAAVVGTTHFYPAAGVAIAITCRVVQLINKIPF